MVLVVGENSVWQNTYNLSLLKPGEVNRMSSVFASAAGKGANVARALRFLARDSLLLGFIGGPNGEKFRTACRADGIAADFTAIEGETRTCTTLIEDSGRITEIVEPAPRVSEPQRAAFHAAVERHLREAEMLIISGTAMQGENDDCYLEFAEGAHALGIPVLLDSYRNHGRRALAAAPEVLKINADELSELSERDCATFTLRREAAREIMARFAVQWIIITRGKEGAEAFDRERAIAATAPAVALRNAIGSGDAFTAGVAAALLEAPARNGSRSGFPWRADIAAALRTGTAMGTANCMSLKPGSIEKGDYTTAEQAVEIGRGQS